MGQGDGWCLEALEPLSVHMSACLSFYLTVIDDRCFLVGVHVWISLGVNE